MRGMLTAEPAVLVHLKSVRVILLVLHSIIVSLLALCAGKSDLHSHFGTSCKISFKCTFLKRACATTPRAHREVE